MFSCRPASGKGTVSKRRQESGKRCTASSLEGWVLAGAVWRGLGDSIEEQHSEHVLTQPCSQQVQLQSR